ncbi:thrombospondin-1-like [Mytilus trossulus]|uniref:thrombospondin-1-like n=1 Tax=Mytilus trossulus TaxID=6551 RepID=UPI003007B805
MHKLTLMCLLSLIVQPVIGNWSPWSSWTECTKPCGRGRKSRERLCDGVGSCSGPGFESDSCNKNACPVNGNWGPWTFNGPCSVTCGQGVQERLRICNDPAPVGDGKPCDGVDIDSQNCVNVEQCAVNGNWGPWTLYGQCSVMCGEGVQTRTRLCNDPAPVGDGAPCNGEMTSSKSCNIEACAAFTATLPGGVYPYQNGGLIGYPIKLLDTRGYSNGIFTVLPGMGGVYSVSVTMMSGSVTGHTTLRKNGDILVWLFTNKEYDMASQTINIHLWFFLMTYFRLMLSKEHAPVFEVHVM